MDGLAKNNDSMDDSKPYCFERCPWIPACKLFRHPIRNFLQLPSHMFLLVLRHSLHFHWFSHYPMRIFSDKNAIAVKNVKPWLNCWICKLNPFTFLTSKVVIELVPVFWLLKLDLIFWQNFLFWVVLIFRAEKLKVDQRSRRGQEVFKIVWSLKANWQKNYLEYGKFSEERLLATLVSGIKIFFKSFLTI